MLVASAAASVIFSLVAAECNFSSTLGANKNPAAERTNSAVSTMNKYSIFLDIIFSRSLHVIIGKLILHESLTDTIQQDFFINAHVKPCKLIFATV